MDPEILRSSFAVVERRAEFAVKYFYSHLFRHNPDLRGLFPLDHPEDMERQRDRLFAALTYVLERLEDPALPGYLRELGRDHRKYLAEPEHYAAVGASLVAAFAVVAGSAWNAEAEKAWGEAYGAITNVMLQGAWESQHADEPPWWDAEVVSRARHGDDLVVLTLRPHQRLRYFPGQYVSVNVPHLPGIWRPYSIGNAPRADLTLDLHVSRVESGVLSTALVRQTREGDVLRLGSPGGGLVLRTPVERPLTFIAASTPGGRRSRHCCSSSTPRTRPGCSSSPVTPRTSTTGRPWNICRPGCPGWASPSSPRRPAAPGPRRPSGC